jgi:hypothetical protein
MPSGPPPPYLRTSERKSFRRCPQQWDWAWNQGLRSTSRPDAPLWFGTGVHIALAEWYDGGFSRGPLPAETFANWVGEEQEAIKVFNNYREDDTDITLAEYEDALILGVAMLEGYIDTYDDDPELETLAVEQPFQVDIVDQDGVIAVFSGTFDGVLLDHADGRIYLWEHKTAGNISTAFLRLDDQAGGYFAVADMVLSHQGILEKDEHIDGVLYNYLRKAMPDERPMNDDGLYLNKDGSVSKNQPKPLFHREVIDRKPREVSAQFRRIRDEVRIMNKMRTGELPVIKNTSWDCPRCPFFNMCVLHEKGGKAWEEFRDLNYIKYDPYQDHRKSAAE